MQHKMCAIFVIKFTLHLRLNVLMRIHISLVALSQVFLKFGHSVHKYKYAWVVYDPNYIDTMASSGPVSPVKKLKDTMRIKVSESISRAVENEFKTRAASGELSLNFTHFSPRLSLIFWCFL